MTLSYMELLYLAAYWILVYEYVVMRHKIVCEESDARIARTFKLELDIYSAILYWNRGTK